MSALFAGYSHLNKSANKSANKAEIFEYGVRRVFDWRVIR